MANPTHIAPWRRGVEAWNEWRRREPSASPDLSAADLRGVDLYFGANLRGADLQHTDVSSAILDGALLTGAKLRNANLGKSSLRKTVWKAADARDVRLAEADLHGEGVDRLAISSQPVGRGELRPLRRGGARSRL